MKYPSLRLVFNRKKTATKEKRSSVQIEVSFQRKKKYITTGVRLTLDQWSEKKQIVVSHAEANDLNNSIANALSSIRKYIIALQEENEEFTFEKFSLHLNSFGNKDSFLDFMYERIASRNLRTSTQQQHLIAYRKLESYGRIKSFADLTTQNIIGFDDFIRKTLSVQTSIHSVHKRIKIYVNEACLRELIRKNPYDCIFRSNRYHLFRSNVYQFFRGNVYQ